MTETIRKSLRDSALTRWTALAIVSFTMLCGYFITDAMNPLKPLLEANNGWNSIEFGTFTGSYGFFNVFLGMLIIGGIVLDKMGVRFTGITSTILMIIGTAINYFAISPFFPDTNLIILHMKIQVWVACFGFAIFGVGAETAGITVSRIIVKWFEGKEMALAMGAQMSTARIGTLLAMAIPLPLAESLGGVSKPILVGLILLCIGLLAYMLYCVQDKKLDAEHLETHNAEEDQFKLSDIKIIVANPGFWLLALLCVLFYSAIFPWLKFATDLMVNKYQVSPEWAGIIPSVLPIGCLILTPLFGIIYDHKGKGATIMIIGSVLLIFTHILFSLPSGTIHIGSFVLSLSSWVVALIATFILGITLSLLPSAMWPSVPKIINGKGLGTAYALTFWVQNWGLMLVPILIGTVLNYTNPDVSPAKQKVKDAVTQTYKELASKLDLNITDSQKFNEKVEKTTNDIINDVLQKTSIEKKSEIKTNDSLTDEMKKSVELALASSTDTDPVKIEQTAIVKMKDATLDFVKKYNLPLRYNYEVPNLIFMIFGILALLVAIALKIQDKKSGYGLEEPIIVKVEDVERLPNVDKETWNG